MSRHILSLSPEQLMAFDLDAFVAHAERLNQQNRETIPAIITSGAPDEIALIENIQRENLHPLDEAHALANLMTRHNYTHEEISKVVGKARNTVTELLGLTTLPQNIQDECRTSDMVSKSMLVEISRLPTVDEQLSFWEQVRRGGVTVRQVRAYKRGDKTSQHQIADHPAAKTLIAGRTFVNKLSKLSSLVAYSQFESIEL